MDFAWWKVRNGKVCLPIGKLDFYMDNNRSLIWFLTMVTGGEKFGGRSLMGYRDCWCLDDIVSEGEILEGDFWWDWFRKKTKCENYGKTTLFIFPSQPDKGKGNFF